MPESLTLESLKNHVLLDWISFLNSKDVVALCCSCVIMKEVLDSNYSVWEHCLSVEPLYVKANRMTLPRIQRNRHCCVWHLYIWQKIQRSTSWMYLLCNMDSYSFASGLVCATFRRIQEIAIDEMLRHLAHKLQLHEMISKHLLITEMEDADEVINGLEAIKVLSRPFVDIVVYQDVFDAASLSETAVCIRRAIIVHQNNLRVLVAAFDACTNLSLHRNQAMYFASEGFADIFNNIIRLNTSALSNRSVMLAGLHSMRNIYDPLNISAGNLEIIMTIAERVLTAKPGDQVVMEAYINHLNQIAVWQAPQMHSRNLFELLTSLDIESDGAAGVRCTAKDLMNRVFHSP